MDVKKYFMENVPELSGTSLGKTLQNKVVLLLGTPPIPYQKKQIDQALRDWFGVKDVVSVVDVEEIDVVVTSQADRDSREVRGYRQEGKVVIAYEDLIVLVGDKIKRQ